MGPHYRVAVTIWVKVTFAGRKVLQLQAMVPMKPGRGCACVDKRRVLQKITPPPNTRNTLMCPSLPYMCLVQQPGQAKTVDPSSSSCPFPARHQDAASIFDTLQPWRALWSCRYSGVAPLYQQLPAKGRRPAGGERKGPANTEGWRTHTGSQHPGERKEEKAWTSWMPCHWFERQQVF